MTRFELQTNHSRLKNYYYFTMKFVASFGVIVQSFPFPSVNQVMRNMTIFEQTVKPYLEHKRCRLNYKLLHRFCEET